MEPLLRSFIKWRRILVLVFSLKRLNVFEICVSYIFLPWIWYFSTSNAILGLYGEIKRFFFWKSSHGLLPFQLYIIYLNAFPISFHFHKATIGDGTKPKLRMRKKLRKTWTFIISREKKCFSVHLLPDRFWRSNSSDFLKFNKIYKFAN